MSWFAQSANETAAGKQHALIFLAVDFAFPSSHAYFWTGFGYITFGGNTYLGVGTLGSIDNPSERTVLGSEQKKYQLSGVDPALVPESDIDNSYGCAVIEYFGFLDAESHALIATPEINWEGTIDSMRRVDGSSPVIEVDAEHRLALLELKDAWRYTDEHQQQFYAGDAGFDQVIPIQLKTVVWTGKNVDPAVQPTYTYPLPHFPLR